MAPTIYIKHPFHFISGLLCLFSNGKHHYWNRRKIHSSKKRENDVTLGAH